jgi:hypothetical protein
MGKNSKRKRKQQKKAAATKNDIKLKPSIVNGEKVCVSVDKPNSSKGVHQNNHTFGPHFRLPRKPICSSPSQSNALNEEPLYPLNPHTCVNDEWQTTEKSWATISPYFQNLKTSAIWMPFYYDGQCARHLRSLGFTHVIHRQEDFFALVNDPSFMRSVDLIWDNPPYTGAALKTKIFEALVACGKPFVMLLPSSILHSKLLQDMLDPRYIQCIVPRRVEVRKTNQVPVPFKYLVWLCYKTNLEKDLIFV